MEKKKVMKKLFLKNILLENYPVKKYIFTDFHRLEKKKKTVIYSQLLAVRIIHAASWVFLNLVTSRAREEFLFSQLHNLRPFILYI